MTALSPLLAMAQETSSSDSVLFAGTVISTASGRPEARCEVQLLNNGEAVKTFITDDEGLFGIDIVPSGEYTLSVFANGNALYRADVSLHDNVSLRIELMPDTVRLHALPPVDVNADRHQLGSLLIRKADDMRLWNFTSNPDLMENGAANEDISWGNYGHCNPLTGVCTPTTGRNPHLRSMLLTPPIWIYCNEPWDPTPIKKVVPLEQNTEAEDDEEED